MDRCFQKIRRISRTNRRPVWTYYPIEEIIEAIRQLSPAYRTVFNMFVIEGLTHEEIAKELGISIGSSKSNLSKARENLRKILIKKTDRKAYVEPIR